MLKKLKQNLANKVALQTAIAGLCVALVMGSIGFFFNLQQLKHRYTNTILEQANTISPSLSVALFSFDNDYLEEIANGLIKHSAISSVVISDINEEPQASASLKRECVSAPHNSLLAPPEQYYLFKLSYSNTLLGKLIVTPDSCSYFSEVQGIILQIVVSSLVFSSIISLFIFIVFHHQVTQPLNRLVSMIGQIDEKSLLDANLAVLQTKRTDEIGVAMNQFAAMLALLKREILHSQQSQATIQSYNYRLESLIDKKSTALNRLQNNQAEHPILTETNADLTLLFANLGFAFQYPNQLLSKLIQQQEHAAALTLSQHIKQLNHCLYLLTRDSSNNKVNLISPEQLSKLCEGSIPTASFSFINDIKDQFLIAEDFLEAVILGLAGNIHFFCKSSSALLHCYQQEQQLRIDISCKSLNLTDDDLDTLILPTEASALNVASMAGLGLLRLLLKSIGGHLELGNFSLQGQTISAYLPFTPKQQLQQQLTSHFEALPLAVLIDSTQLYHKIIDLLNRWSIPFSLTLTAEQQLLITDQTEHQHPPKQTLYLQADQQEHPSESELALSILGLIEKQAATAKPVINVLIADHNQINLEYCLGILKPFNYQITTAHNGVEAVDLAQQHKFQLIFMAADMPIMDGLTATRKIRHSSQNQQTPIVAMANPHTNDQQQCLLAGMDDFISKPFTEKQLITIIDQWSDGI